MSNQHDFGFRESAEDATQAAIHKSGKALKALAFDLWPTLKADSAYARLRGCLNHDRPEKLSADEHIAIARLTGQYDFLHYVAQELHHSRPEPVAPEDELTGLLRQFNENARGLAKLGERIQAMKGGAE